MKGHCNSNERVELTLKVRRKAPLPALPGRPATPMTRKELADKYGASDADMAKVKAAMTKYGLEVLGDSQACRSIHVAGPIKLLEDVFKVKLFEYAQRARRLQRSRWDGSHPHRTGWNRHGGLRSG